MTSYGLALKDLRRLVTAMGVLASVFLVIELSVSLWDHTTSKHIGLLLLRPAVIAFGVPAFIVIFSLLRMAVEGTHVQLRFGPWLIRQEDVKDLTIISLRNRVFPVILRFRNGRRMFVLAIPLWHRQALRQDLCALVRHPIEVRA